MCYIRLSCSTMGTASVWYQGAPGTKATSECQQAEYAAVAAGMCSMGHMKHPQIARTRFNHWHSCSSFHHFCKLLCHIHVLLGYLTVAHNTGGSEVTTDQSHSQRRLQCLEIACGRLYSSEYLSAQVSQSAATLEDIYLDNDIHIEPTHATMYTAGAPQQAQFWLEAVFQIECCRFATYCCGRQGFFE